MAKMFSCFRCTVKAGRWKSQKVTMCNEKLLTFFLLLSCIITSSCSAIDQTQIGLSGGIGGIIPNGPLTTIQDAAIRFGLNSNTNSLDIAQQLRYDAPDDCKYTTSNNYQDVSLVCNLRTVNSEFDTTNFSVIPSEHTVALTVVCNDEIMAKSSLEQRSFVHLGRLKELHIEYCKIAKFSQDVLYGLNDLRNLTLRTHNNNWPALNLEIESDSFVNSKNLERLDLSMNNIWSLPENLFCMLNGLTFLNISENRLQDINDLGFREKSTTGQGVNKDDNSSNRHPDSVHQHQQKSVCVLDLETLDVSNNHFVLLPANGFGTLKRLKHLKIHDNEISMVADKALGGLKNLQILDISSNKIVALPPELFKDPAQSIQEVYLQNNSISVLSPGLFSNLEQLQALDLSSNQLTSTWINRTTFAGLIRLVLLNISNNKITKLDQEIFADLYTLQILNLRYNQLESIAADTFSPMNNLHTLMLSHNKIKYLDAYSLNGLYVLSLLALDNNLLTGVHPEAFRNCSSLQDLNLNGNELRSVPLALKDMRLLRTVDLGENKITVLDEPGFRGMSNLYGLRLIGNGLENISRNAFKDLPSLQILNLAHNKIKFIEPGTFQLTEFIQAIRLDGNDLPNIDGLFTNIPHLLWLNISDNKLEHFDFSQIPNGLQWLDLHKNELTELSNRYILDNQLSLQTLDASFNKLQKVTTHSVPNSIELLFLNDNLITSIEAHAFMNKTNLTRVDLYANQITSLDIKALRLAPVEERRFLPEFYIGGNPFICDCNIDWLQKINQLTTRQYPRIMDLETIYCKLLYNRDRAYIPLIEAEPMHFLCAYKTHCFALCHCCEFDACDCEMTCPTNCTCFHDQSWSTNVVECSSAGYTDMPANIPMDTTEVYIDGNNLGELSGHSFIGRKNLRVLYANNSNIQLIYNTTFNGLKKLTILHLENNKITRFVGQEFASLDNLRELYLQNNKISFIENQTFLELRKLEVLRLDGNKLMHFEVWQLRLNPYLVEIGLADNSWSCDCNYLSKFRNYLQTNSEKIIDSTRIACVYNNLTSILKEKNGTKCTLKDGVSPIIRSKEIEDLLPLLLAATCAFVGFFGLIMGVFCYRRELRIWAHTHCFPNMCYKTANFVDDFDKDRLYDAYITYSLQDEHFVNQILANTLENDVGYRLCLHYRDFNVNTYVADTIIEAVESSKRTILVLSKNFLYNEWSRFEFKSAIHEVIKRRRKLIFVLYGDLPQRDIDAEMRLYLRTNTCIEWDDKKFWQKLRITLPPIRKNHCLAKRSAVNIYATTHHDYNASTMRRNECPVRLDCNNYATIGNCGSRSCSGGGVGAAGVNGAIVDSYDTVSCKFNTTTNERRHKQNVVGGAIGAGNEFITSGAVVGGCGINSGTNGAAGGIGAVLTLNKSERQHDYAVPIIPSGGIAGIITLPPPPPISNNKYHVGTIDGNGSSKYSSRSECSRSSTASSSSTSTASSGGIGGVGVIGSAVGFSYNNRINNSINNYNNSSNNCSVGGMSISNSGMIINNNINNNNINNNIHGNNNNNNNNHINGNNINNNNNTGDIILGCNNSNNTLPLPLHLNITNNTSAIATAITPSSSSSSSSTIKSDNKNNCTIGDANCIDRRLPQAMWA